MIGQTISHYRIIGELGSGAMGTVYEAEDTRLGRRVAIKRLADDARRSPETLERFRREARIVSSLSHPHIAVLHDLGEHEGEQYMVMELLEGEPLKARIARGALPVDEVLDLGIQIADALDAAHAQGVVHRDIKPANLFITKRGQVKVLDFGVAKFAERHKAGDGTATISGDEGLTTVGTALGTVSYMSPEQARGQEIDGRSDLFSFGVVLYEMATGRPPFPGATPAVIFEGILTRTPPPPSSLDDGLPRELDRIIATALEKSVETRYQSAAELRADLKRLKRDTDTMRAVVTSAAAGGVRPPDLGAGAAGRPAASTRRLAWAFGAPLATLALVGGALLWYSTRAPALTARDSVVLADFVNRTGDAMFDGTMAEALALQLRQSPFLNLLPDQQTQATLRLMGQDPMATITPDIGRDLCQRVGAKALLGGSISGLGSSYVITLHAQDCVTGDTLAEEQVQAASKEAVLAELGSAATRLRERLGESLPSIQRYGMRVEEATTGSLDALKAYSQGVAARRTQGDRESIPFFRRAIDLDPKFALAHARLGTVLGNLGNRSESIESTELAFDLRDRASERERLYIEARYYSTVAGDIQKAVDTYLLLTSTYPDDHAGHTNLALLYKSAGRTDQAIAELKESIRIAPNEPLGPFNLGYAYIDLGDYAEARKAFEQTVALRDGTPARLGLFAVATLTGDKALADAQVAAVAGRRDAGAMVGMQAVAAAYRGRLREAEAFNAQWLRAMEGSPNPEAAAQGLIGMAISNAIWGRADAAHRQLAEAERRRLLQEPSVADDLLAVASALGDGKLAQTWLSAALAYAKETSVPEELPDYEQTLRAMASLASGRNREAYELASAVPVRLTTARAGLIAGLAASRLNEWENARKSLESMLGYRRQFALDPVTPFARLLLAKAQAESGDRAAARATYEAAFDHLKNADPDLPLLVEAKREYEKLGT